MKFPVWLEGYRATGNSAPARFLGTYEAPTFIEACRAAVAEHGMQESYTEIPHPSFWGCRMYDSEFAARSIFG